MPNMIENRMVVDSEWKWKEQYPEIAEKLHSKGYFEMGTGNFVPEEDAFSYAMERIKEGTEEEKWEFIDWFYSSNWIKED